MAASGKGNEPDRRSPSDETLRAFLALEWADLHHSRVQEWTALGVTAGVHYALGQFGGFVVTEMKLPGVVTLGVAAVVGALFAILGGLITLRHRRLMRVKLHWIFAAEDQLGLIKDARHERGIVPRSEAPIQKVPWRGLSWPRPLSTSALLLAFYGAFLLADLIVLGWSLRGGSF